MSKSSASDSESEANSSSSEEEMEPPKPEIGGKKKKVSNYENQRLKTIEENKARMKALGLNTMANSLMGSSQIVKKGYEKKVKKGYDEDYRVEDEELSGSDEEEEKKKKGHVDKKVTTLKKQKVLSEEDMEPLKPEIGGKKKKVPNYEQQRLKTIEENKARMKALGLKTMASSLMGSSQIVKKGYEKKGKMKEGYDEDYRVEDEELSGSDEGEEKKKKGRVDKKVTTLKKQKGNNRSTKPIKPAGHTQKKGNTKYKLLGEPAYVDDDDAMMQAIAMSLQDSAGFLNLKTQPSQSSDVQVVNSSSSLKNQDAQLQDSVGKRKRKKPFDNRVKITEDDVILHFFQFDEAGKGSISLRDVQRMAAVHDFTWSDKEMADMIKYFDSDGHGKLNLEDFRKIALRCNMIERKEDSPS